MSVKITGVAEVNANLQKAVEKMRQAAETAMQEVAELLQEYARANHPWQNQSGQTEATTQAGITELSADLIRVTLSTETDYSKFLELARDGTWAWLWPMLVACEEAIKAILIKHLGVGRVQNFQLQRGATSL